MIWEKVVSDETQTRGWKHRTGNFTQSAKLEKLPLRFPVEN